MEEHLTESMDIEDIAGKAALSPFYYQRIFGALCGMTVGEYIRARRMTLAAQELAGSEEKVIDVATKYGYDSPDSFSKAFQRFHGITPSQARESGAPLRSFAPLHIKITLEGTPWEDIQEGCETTIIPESLWAEFVCKGPLPDSLQTVNTQIWSEWLLSLTGYELAGNYSIEVYMPPAENPADTISYICVPLKKI